MYAYESFLPSEPLWQIIRSKYDQNEMDFDPIGIHGWMHAYRCCYAAQALQDAYPDFYAIPLSREVIRIVVASHDIGRKNNGTDRWEKDSAIWCTDFLVEHLSFTAEDARTIGNCIIKEQKAVFPKLQDLLHDADALEYSRLLPPADFDYNRLIVVQQLGVSVISTISPILERLLAMQEDEIYFKLQNG